MKILWIYPDKQKCGISIYSHDYIQELEKKCEIITADPDELMELSVFLKKVENADLVHIQYETSFFIKKGKDTFLQLLKCIRKPIIVSLHEIYEEFPGIYPRSKISGPELLIPFKKMLYDLKHPVQTAFLKHCNVNFGAKLILVHQLFQKAIIQKKCNGFQHIEVLPHPVKMLAQKQPFSWTDGQIIRFGSTGFINPGYDYPLLFSVLSQINTKWKFTWIGGIRNDEHNFLLNEIKQEIIKNNWQERFLITGWVSEKEQKELLNNTDIYLALFKHRSSSGTLSRAIGSLKPIIATEIPLTEEICSSFSGQKYSPLVLVKNDPLNVVNCIYKLLFDSEFRDTTLERVQYYAKTVDFSDMADKLISIYGGFCK